MSATCKNCQQNFEGNFCNFCGQSADTHPINFHFLWHDIQHGLFHVDKGILFTCKELVTRPGKSIAEFLDGKRVKHFKPFSMVIVLGTIFGILYHYFHINMLMETEAGLQVTSQGGKPTVETLKGPTLEEAMKTLNEWLSTHYSWATLMLLPFYALSTRLAFFKSGYNYVQHLVINAFISAQGLLIHIVAFPLMYIYNGTKSMVTLVLLLDLFCFAFRAWAYWDLFSGYSKLKRILFSVLSYIYFTLMLILLTTIVSLVYLFFV